MIRYNIETDDLYYRGDVETLQRMSSQEKHCIWNELTKEYKRRWMSELHRRHPHAGETEWRQIVINEVLRESQEERDIAMGHWRRLNCTFPANESVCPDRL